MREHFGRLFYKDSYTTSHLVDLTPPPPPPQKKKKKTKTKKNVPFLLWLCLNTLFGNSSKFL